MHVPDPTLPTPGTFAHRSALHYHGDVVRIMFIAAAIIMLVGESTGALLPLSTTDTVFAAILLVVLAGITNPEQKWIHWINAAVAIAGTALFGTNAITHYQLVHSIFDPSYAYTEILALLSLITIYFSVKTVRGVLLRPDLS